LEEENIIGSHGFSDLSEIKQKLYRFLKNESIFQQTFNRKDFKILLNLMKLRIQNIEDPNVNIIDSIIINLLTILIDQMKSIWNNPILINLLSISLYNCKNYLILNNFYEKFNRLIKSLIDYQFSQSDIWAMEDKDFFNQILPLILFCGNDCDGFFQKFIAKIKIKRFGDKKCLNWINNLLLVNAGKGDVYELISTLPVEFTCYIEDLTKLNIIWFSTKSSIQFVPSIFSISNSIVNQNQKYNDLTLNDWILEWIVMEYQILAHKIDINNGIKNYKHEIPISELSPLEFERLGFWILKSDPQWLEVQWRGEAGGEKGKDHMAIHKETRRKWIFQCKRVKNFGSSDFEKEFEKVLPELIHYKCEGYLLIISRKITDKLYKTIENTIIEYGFKVKIYNKSELEYRIKNSKPIFNEFFGYSN